MQTSAAVLQWRGLFVVMIGLALLWALVPATTEARLSGLASTRLQMVLCRAGGGTPEVVVNRTGEGIDHTRVNCAGGALSDMQCINVDHEVTGKPIAECTGVKTSVDTGNQGQHVHPTEGIGQDVSDEAVPAADLNAVPLDEGALLEIPEQLSVAEATLAQVNGCRMLGGTEILTVAYDARGSLVESAVRCDGGFIDGFDCVNAWESFTCEWLRGVPEGEILVDTSKVAFVTELPRPANAEQPPAAPSPPVVPIEEAEVVEPTAEPTSMPTIAPTEPTDPPVFPTPPTDDIVVPPGEAEDPVVEPTPVILD